MTDYAGNIFWKDEIKIIKISDQASGGLNSASNQPHQDLADRTTFLRNLIDTTGNALSGDVFFTRLQVDNLVLDGNTISTSGQGGGIILIPEPSVGLFPEGVQIQQGRFEIHDDEPQILFEESDASQENKNWKININSEQFNVYAVSDDELTVTAGMQMSRTSSTVDNVTISPKLTVDDIVIDSNIISTSASGSPLIFILPISGGSFPTDATIKQGRLKISDNVPQIVLQETGASIDNKLWKLRANNEQLQFSAISDDELTADSFMTVDRSSGSVDSVVISPSLTVDSVNINSNVVGTSAVGNDFLILNSQDAQIKIGVDVGAQSADITLTPSSGQNVIIESNAIANEPTGSTHLTTKNYVDTLVNATSSLGVGTMDHGSLNGLSDDDHIQYFELTGIRKISGDVDIINGGKLDVGDVTIDGNVIGTSATNDNYLILNTQDAQIKIGVDVGAQSADITLTPSVGQNVIIESNAIANEPTGSTHLTTKNYVDTLVNATSSTGGIYFSTFGSANTISSVTSGGGTGTVNITGVGNNGINVQTLKVLPNGQVSSYKIRSYRDDAFVNADDANGRPRVQYESSDITTSATSATVFLDFINGQWFDDDITGEIHIEVTNNGDTSSDFDIELEGTSIG